MTQRYVDQLRIKTPSLETAVAGLSGGNQQKIALAKWLARQCAVLIVDEPTRGVDVGAKAEIHHLLDDLACQGLALIVISSELPEVINCSLPLAEHRDVPGRRNRLGRIARTGSCREFASTRRSSSISKARPGPTRKRNATRSRSLS